jgi:hypothetical protein
MRNSKYRLTFKEIVNPDGDLSDTKNIKTITEYYDTLEEAENHAEAVRKTAGRWSPEIDGPFEMD